MGSRTEYGVCRSANALLLIDIGCVSMLYEFVAGGIEIPFDFPAIVSNIYKIRDRLEP